MLMGKRKFIKRLVLCFMLCRLSVKFVTARGINADAIADAVDAGVLKKVKQELVDETLQGETHMIVGFID